MLDSWIVLAPPLLVLLVAFTTQRIVYALLGGIISAAFILHNGSIIQSVKTVIVSLWQTSQLSNLTSWNGFLASDTILIFLFLLLIGVLITLISHSGGAYAYGTLIRKRIKDARSAESASFLLSLLFFIDDSFSCVTVSSIMRPITDQFNIARAKLAFLVNSIAGPLCLITPISSWVAVVVMQLRTAGIGENGSAHVLVSDDPFYIFLQMIPFAFYSFIMLASVWFIIRKRISFGLMYTHEKTARETQNLFGGKNPPNKKLSEVHESNVAKESIIDFIVPVVTLIVFVALGLLYFGDSYLLGGTRSFAYVIQNSNIILALLVGVLVSVLVTTVLLFVRRKLCIKTLPIVLLDGIKLMSPCIVVLVLAWSFGSLLRDDLGTGVYLAKHLIRNVPLIFVPVLFLVASSLTSLAMGSAWGTFAVMIPIAVPMVVALQHVATPTTWIHLPLLLPTLSAVISGAVSGNHLSPISDNTILTANSVGAHLIDHVKTRLWYAIPTLISTGIAFIISGLMAQFGIWLNVLVSLSVGICFNFLLLTALNKAYSARRNFKLQHVK